MRARALIILDHPYHLIFAAFFISALLKGITGLGFSTICLALLASVIDLRTAIPMVLVPSLGSNMLVMFQAGEFKPMLREFRWLYLAAIPGLITGLTLLDVVAANATSAMLGSVIITYAVFALSNPEFRLSNTTARPLQIPVGLLTGVITGATGSQIMPVLPYLMSLGLSPDRFVQAINISFTGASLVMLAGLAYLGYAEPTTLLVSSLGFIPVYIGIKLGGKLRKALPEHVFRNCVLIMLVALGINLIRGLFA